MNKDKLEQQVRKLKDKDEYVKLQAELGRKLIELETSPDDRRLAIERSYEETWGVYAKLLKAVGRIQNNWPDNRIAGKSHFTPINLKDATSTESGGGLIQAVLTPFNSREYFHLRYKSYGSYDADTANSCLVSVFQLGGSSTTLLQREWFTPATDVFRINENSQQYVKSKYEALKTPYTDIELVAAEAAVGFMVNQSTETLDLLVNAASNPQLNPTITQSVRAAFGHADQLASS